MNDPARAHEWEVEELDSGPMGIAHFWRCSTCGAAGGPQGWWPAEPERRWHPFLAGAGVQLTEDCIESQALIWEHVTERLEVLGTLTPFGPSPKYAALVKDSLRRTPAKTDVTALLGLMDDIENLGRRPTLAEAAARLSAAGFHPSQGEIDGESPAGIPSLG